MKGETSYKLRFILSIFWIVLGIVLIVLCKTGNIDSEPWSAIGGALIGVGIMQLIRKIRYLKDPEYKERVDVGVNDERNNYVRMKAWSWTGYIFIIGSAVLSVVFMIAGNPVVSQVLGLCACAQLIIYVGAYYIFRNRY